MEKTASFCLKLMGWTVNDFRPAEKKYVLIVAPHTSAMDFVIGRLAFWTKGLPARFFIKKEFFVFPIRRLLKALGGMPIDRQQAGNVVEHSVNLLKEADELALIITPEGTRKATTHWKKGFYYIALGAKIPIVLIGIDYEKKCITAGKYLLPTGDIEKDMKEIKLYFKDFKGKHSEKFTIGNID